MSLTNTPLTITEEQINAFKTWTRERYSDYEAYKTGSQTQNYVDVYIRSNILPPEMKAVWDESERYVGMRTSSTDPIINEVKLYRKKIQQKVRYMKDKLGKLAYREELIQIRLQEQTRLQEREIQLQEQQIRFENMILLREQEERSIIRQYGGIALRIMNSIERRIELEITQAPEEERQQLREQSQTRIEDEFVGRIGRFIERDRINRNLHLYNPYPPPIRPLTTTTHLTTTTPLTTKVTYHKKTVTEETLRTTMVDDCCICLNKHQMCSVIEGPCGHQIGKGCFQEWVKKSTTTTTTTTTTRCPLCRTDCNEVTEFIPQEIHTEHHTTHTTHTQPTH